MVSVHTQDHVQTNMKLFVETTKWAGDFPNHAYYLSDDKSKMYAYVKENTQEVITFKKPYRFDARHRTFLVVPKNVFGYTKPEEDKKVESWEVEGSKGTKYLVEKIEGVLKCSCPGFTYRGDCRHIKEVK